MLQRGFAPILIILFIVILAGAGFFGYNFYNQYQESKITNFDECAKANNPVLESYPAQCITKDKRHFTQELTEEEKQRLIPPTESIPSSSQSVNWKTFKGDGFSISFPENWLQDPSLKGLIATANNITTKKSGFIIISPEYDHNSGGYINQGAVITLFKNNIPWPTDKKVGEQLGPESIRSTKWLGVDASLQVNKYEGDYLILTAEFKGIKYQLIMSTADDKTRNSYEQIFLKIADSLVLE